MEKAAKGASGTGAPAARKLSLFGLPGQKFARGAFWSHWPARILVGSLATLFFLFLGVPLASLLFREPPGVIWAELQQPDIFQALQLSLLTTTLSTLMAFVFGLPVAYVLARKSFPGRKVLEIIVTLPTVLPPVVAGVALLLTFGRMGLIGQYLALLGLNIPFTTVAVVMAQTFIAAPFFVNSARAGFEQLDRRYELAAYTLRASPFYTFRRVILPLIRPALLAGTGLAWARSLGEFGATITFAGNFPGTTQTMPIAVYMASQDDLDKAIALAVVLLAVSFGMLLALKYDFSREKPRPTL
ncbi:molybdate ABC transporter permease subunit [Ktedonosporobacter rubrisoli]|uniref:Molybdenum transport system permease n=1 Tax=Ktedonosporobacter rubrisoli TaxID=2509675 RepID=A0A4P6JXL5_KTERU|nr:ABC transporter permease [Ktedonosporobacter rubrisoli]QBD80499.1 molybdate ABC transporter permease subunit [Ktedonosporobacter rubrisoli]